MEGNRFEAMLIAPSVESRYNFSNILKIFGFEYKSEYFAILAKDYEKLQGDFYIVK